MTTFHSIEEKKMRNLGLIAKDNVAEQASIITDNIMRKQDMGHQGNSGVSLSFGLQLICDAYGCGDEVDDEDAKEDVAEDAVEEGEEAASNDDIPTRNQTAPEEVMMKSIWQSEPAYLTLPREPWPCSRQFKDTVPEAETIAPNAELNLAVLGVGNRGLDNMAVAGMIRELLTKSNNLDETVGVMAPS